MSRVLLSAAAFHLTLLLAILRPRGMGIGWAGFIGALVTLSAGLVSPQDVARILGIVWNATLALVGIIIIARVLDGAGFFSWAALHAARLARGNGHRAFVFVVLFGALVAGFFTNDGAVLW